MKLGLWNSARPGPEHVVQGAVKKEFISALSALSALK